MSKTAPRSVLAFLTALLLSAAMPARGQFALEHVYAGGSYSSMPGFQFANQLFLLELESSGWKYVRIDRETRQVVFYNLDHSLWKSVSFAMATVLNPNVSGQDVLYISEHLFDLDDGIEFMYTNVFTNGIDPPVCVTQVVDEETAGLIFNVSDQYATVRLNFRMQQYPIQSTPVGTKLILSGIVSDSAYVYGLAGDLPTGMLEGGGQERAAEAMELFPNPSSTELTVSLPAWRSNASMEIISGTGQVVRTIMVTGTATTIDIRALATGAYVCRIQGGDGRPCIGTFIKN